MPTKDSKTITLRVPNRVNFGDVNLHKFVTSLYDMVSIGAVKIVNNELVMPEGTSEEADSDGEWVREMAHRLNMDTGKFKRTVEQGMRL